MTLKVITQDQYGVTYADPADPDFHIRFKTTTARKSVDGESLQNYVGEVIITDNYLVPNRNANEALSVRIRTSGSIENKARLMSMLNIIGLNLSAWSDESVFFGFPPDSAPVTE